MNVGEREGRRLARGSAAVLAAVLVCGGCGGSSPAPPPKNAPAPGPETPSVAVEKEKPSGGPPVSPAGERQRETIESLQRAGVKVETNGFRESKVASLADAELGSRAARMLGELDTLEQVRLWNCSDADDALVTRLAGLKELRALTVRGGVVTDAVWGALAKSPALESLNLGDSPGVTGSGAAVLLEAGRLKRLHLDGTGLTDEALAAWPGKLTLEVLGLNRTSISDAAVESLSRWQTLKSVYVRGTRLTAGGLARLKAALPRCVVIGEPDPASAGEATPPGPARR